MDYFFRKKTGRFLVMFLSGAVLLVLALYMLVGRIGRPSDKDYTVVLPYIHEERLGFWADLEPGTSLAAEAAYAQYGVAPAILTYTDPTCCEQLMVSLINTDEVPAFEGYTVQQTFDDGIYLLERQ